MEWTKLDIRKASVLKKQVDLALLTLKQAFLDGDVTRKNALLVSFNNHIDNIEEFRAVHDSDERSILFERERLRLRKAVQEAQGSANINSIFQGAAQVDGTRTESPTASTKSSSGVRSPLPKSPEFSARSSQKEKKEVATIASAAPSLSQNPTKKIYAWESGIINADIRSAIDIDNVTFVPAEEPGIYLRSDEMVTGAASTEKLAKHADMFVVLSADEINILASRLLHSKQTDKAVFKNSYSAQGVQHSTPYVDQARIQQALLRPEQPDKWIDKTSIRPNAK